MPKTLNGGTFNLEYGRVKGRVIGETERLGREHNLDFLNVQEFGDYRDAFEDSDYWNPFPKFGPCESGILVRRGVPVERVSRHDYGDGWITVRGGRFPAATHTELLMDDWLWDRSVHLPTPTEWRNGRVKSPDERADDLRETVLGLEDYFDHPCAVNARMAAGDWNEPPTTKGVFSPRWLAFKSGAQIAVPDSRAGHGRIDYALVKGARVVGIVKDTAIPELSDHEPVIFRVVKR